MKRASGVLMHISTLFGDYSIGSLGDNARKFIDFLAECGFTYWQVLPFCMPDGFNSPYNSFSAFSCNPLFIDLEILEKKKYITKGDLAAARQNSPYSCEFERLTVERIELLKKASKNADRGTVQAFIARHPQIGKFCEFMALKSKNDNTEWHDWKRLDFDCDALFMWQFTQYEFFVQWSEIKAYANSCGIKIIGDMPMFVAYDSSDVFYNKKQFLLDEQGKPQCTAGVPPDYFSATGQVWSNPIYDWDEMQTNEFSWWKERFKHMLELFDGVRIDHFRGLESCFAIPVGKTASDGKWMKAKGREMLDAVKDLTSDRLMIAEDLGEITPEVRKLVDYSGFLCMRVMQFGFLSKEDSLHRCHNYCKNCVAYTGTHDNNTLLGYVWELPEQNRKLLFDYCGYSGDIDHAYDSIIRTLFASVADIVIVPIQDILSFGSDTRMNFPGKCTEGNWAFRITEDNLKKIDVEKYRHLNELYSR